MVCGGCGGELTTLEAAMAERDNHLICMGCVGARQRAVVSGKCCCGRKRRPVEMRTGGHARVLQDGTYEYRGGRQWISCERCLGTVRQVA